MKKGHIPYIVYELFDVKMALIRIGYSKYTATQRKKWYLMRALNFKDKMIPEGWGKIYKAIQECGSKLEAEKRFRMYVRYIIPSKGEAKIMEEFLTIYRNRANNKVGYDLSINNNYNAIVGDFFKGMDNTGNFKPIVKGNLAHNWREIPPDILAQDVLDGLGMNELMKKFGVSPKTMRRRFKAYGYGVKEIYDLNDARAFLIKPHILEGIKRAYTQDEFFSYCKKKGINIFNKFKYIKNQENSRGAFFRRMLKQIWGNSRHKEVRYLVISEYIISIIKKPDITPWEAESEIKKIFKLKYDGEFARICNHIFGKDFVKKRDQIYRPIIKKLAIKYKEYHNINLKIAVNIGLCKEEDPAKVREKASSWVKQYVKRNFGCTVRELIGYLVPGFSESKSIKQMIYEYMENHSIARPEEISKDFPDLNKNTISFNVKIWKKFNLQKIKEYPSILINKYLNEMDLDQQIRRLANKLLKDYLGSKLLP